MLFHCKPVNQQKTTIFALILWEEQRLNRFWSEKRCWNSTFTLGSQKSVIPSSFNTYLVMWKYNCEPLWSVPNTAVCLGVSSQIKLLKKKWTNKIYVVDKQVIHVFLGQILILASHTFNDKIFKGLLVWFSV